MRTIVRSALFLGTPLCATAEPSKDAPPSKDTPPSKDNASHAKAKKDSKKDAKAPETK